MVMSLVVISLKDFSVNLRREIFHGLLPAILTDQKYKWPPPIA